MRLRNTNVPVFWCLLLLNACADKNPACSYNPIKEADLTDLLNHLELLSEAKSASFRGYAGDSAVYTFGVDDQELNHKVSSILEANRVYSFSYEDSVLSLVKMDMFKYCSYFYQDSLFVDWINTKHPNYNSEHPITQNIKAFSDKYSCQKWILNNDYRYYSISENTLVYFDIAYGID